MLSGLQRPVLLRRPRRPARPLRQQDGHPVLQERKVALSTPSQPYFRDLRPLGLHRRLIRGRRRDLQPGLEGPGTEFKTF